MQPNSEINALLALMDDPDEEVYQTVEQRLMSYGSPLIPQLENLWENTISEEVQERIEMVIHRIQFMDLKQELVQWLKGDMDLLHGALLVSKFAYPELQIIKPLQEFEKMRRNLWLEMNNFITPVEQVKIFESILYNYYKLRGGEINYSKTDDFVISKVIDGKKGNALTTGILYIALAEKLDVPIRALRIPRQFVLGYFSQQALFNQSFEDDNPAEKIKFFVDPNSGTAFSHKDMNQYFTRMNLSPSGRYFKPISNTGIIKVLFSQFARCFDKPETLYRKNELEELAEMLKD
jgi:hypothetical protein